MIRTFNDGFYSRDVGSRRTDSLGHGMMAGSGAYYVGISEYYDDDGSDGHQNVQVRYNVTNVKRAHDPTSILRVSDDEWAHDVSPII